MAPKTVAVVSSRSTGLPGPQNGGTGPVEVRSARDLKAIPPGLWDSLLEPDDLQCSHRFIRLCQEARVEEADYWHLLIYQAGRLGGVATLSRMKARLDLLATGFPRAALGALRRCWPGALRVPVLFCGLPLSFGQPCLKFAPWADREAVCRAITRTMETVAEATATPLLCFKEFDPDAATLVEPVCGRGYFRAPSLPSCSLPLTWGSFASYVRAMTAGYRRQVRATLRARAAAGLKVRRVDHFARAGKTLFSLYEQVIQRAAFRLETLNRAFLERLDTDLGGQSRAILIERGGQTLAAGIMLFTSGVATFLLAGLDYRARRSWQVYPNLLLEVVAEAIHSGASRLELGQTSYALKSRLGAVEVPRFLFLRYRHSLGQFLLRRGARFLFPTLPYPRRRVFS
ncbi:MAG: GNAT family N-acetyltransferase, partial [Planctomycetes bacterium]|nr:GNAT family N-acetyltransferase [Planctomycetota bacterium]